MLAKKRSIVFYLFSVALIQAEPQVSDSMIKVSAPSKVAKEVKQSQVDDKSNINVDVQIKVPKCAEKEVKPAPVAAKSSIAIVDVQKIINETQVDKDFVQDLINKQQKFQEELKKKMEEIQKREQNLKVKASTLSPDALKKQYEELDDMRVQGNRLAERRQKELQEEEMKTRFNVFKTIQGYSQDMIKKNPYIDIVQDKNGGILAYAPRTEKTDELTALIKEDLAKKEAAKKKKATAEKKMKSAQEKKK